MLLGNRFVVVLAILVGLAWTSDAIRGAGRGGLRRRRDGSIVFEVEHSAHRRTAHWAGATEDSPPEIQARHHKEPKGKPDDSSAEEELDDPEEREFVFGTEDEPKKARGKHKGKKDNSVTPSTSEIDCDDPENPLCNQPIPDQVTDQLDEDSIMARPDLDELDNLSRETPSDTDTNTDTDSGSSSIYDGHHVSFGSGTTAGTAEEPTTTMRREIPTFKISFALSVGLYEDDLDNGDYAELSDSTELYLTQYFTEYYEGEPTIFHEVNVIVQKTDNPLIVRFYVIPSFVIPGNVPTMTNLFDRMNDAFSGARVPEYISILNSMGMYNPFKNTRAIALINETPVSLKGNENSGGGDGSSLDDNDSKFWSIVIGAAVLVLVIVGLLWVYHQRQREKADAIHRMELDDVEDQDIASLKRRAFSTKALRTDANTSGYLDSIRNRYKDGSDSKTDLDDASHDDEGMNSPQDDDEMTEATDNRQTPAEFHEKIMNSLSYPAPPSDGDQKIDGEESKEPETPSQSPKKLQSEYLNYLDMDGTSFDEEDLRS